MPEVQSNRAVRMRRQTYSVQYSKKDGDGRGRAGADMYMTGTPYSPILEMAAACILQRFGSKSVKRSHQVVCSACFLDLLAC